MFRASVKVSKILPKVISVQTRGLKLSNVLKSSDLSTPTPKKGGIIKKLLALTIVSSGGVMGYSWYDPEFRKLLEDNVPYAKEVFDALFENLPSKDDVSKMIGGPEGIKPKQVLKDDSFKPKPVVVEKTKKESDEDKKRERENLLKEQKENEANKLIELERGLQQLSEELKKKVLNVLEAGKKAIEVSKEHSRKLKEALQAEDSSEWDEVTRSQEIRVQTASLFEQLEAKTREELRTLWDEVSQLKKEKIYKSNKIVSQVSSEVEKLNKELNKTVKQFGQAQLEAKVFNDYKDLVKKGRERFKKELESIMPTIKDLPSSFSKMSEDELNALIGHAHKRIDQLQNQLAEQKALEQLRLIEEVELRKNKESWAEEAEALHIKWEADSRAGFENELKQQMIRQTSAHNEHLSEALQAQKRELEALYELRLNEMVQQERRSFQLEMAAWMSRMQGIEDAVKKRAEFEEQSHSLQRLWLACEALQTAISTGNPGANSWQDRLKPLKPEVELIKKSFPDQPVIRVLLDSMPEAALNRGVWTEGALIERFKKVDKVCRQVSLVDETAGLNGSIFRYILSSLQSKLVVHGVSKVYQNPDDQIDKKDLDNVFFLLDNAQAALDRGDLTLAVKFVNQLRGEPRRAASDWLNEARLLLETKQLSTALLASASAAGFSSVAATT